jgi:MFS family permease
MSPLRRLDPDLRRLMTSAVLVIAGTEATAIVLALSVLHMTGSTYWVSAVLAASLGLAMLLGPFGGVVADRYDRRKVLLGVTLLEAMIFALAALAATRPWELLVAAALAAVVAVPYGPAQAAAVQALISEERLPGANAALFGSNQVAVLVAPAAAGIAYALVGGRLAMAGIGLAYAGAAAAVTRLRGETRPDDAEPRRGFVREASAGFGQLLRARMVLVTTIAVAVMIAVDGAVVVAMIPLAGIFHHGGSGFGIEMSACGLGMLGGSYVAGRLTARRDPLHVFAFGSAAFGLGIGLVAIAPSFPVVLAGLALSGAGNGLFGTAEMLIYQRSLDNRVMGRVRAAAVSILNGTYALSMVCAGELVHTLGVRGVFALGGAGGAAATAVVVAAALMRSVPAPEALPAQTG